MEIKKVYLSLPIRNYDLSERIETAMKAEVRLRGAGYEVFNPLGKDWKSGLTDEEYMRIDLKALLDCDTIFLMHGWHNSANCCRELNNAVACGMNVWFEDQINIELLTTYKK